VLAIGKENTAYWQHHFGSGFPLFQFNYAVDNQFFQTACAKRRRRARSFALPSGLRLAAIVLFAAKLSARKRCGDLLAAYLQLARRSTTSGSLLLIVVTANSAQCWRPARMSRLGDVRFLGFRNQSELPRFYDLCMCLCLRCRRALGLA